MSKDSDQKQSPAKKSTQKWLPTWFKICIFVLIFLVVLKSLGWEVFVRFDYDGERFLAGLTEIETYLIPLGLLLVYFLFSWLWDKFSS